MAWTAAQQQAIESRGSGLIVSAAAGSGKTSVLVERLLRILTEEDPEKRVPADRMIVVTFTNDAAAEMKARLSGLGSSDSAKSGKSLALSAANPAAKRTDLYNQFVLLLSDSQSFHTRRHYIRIPDFKRYRKPHDCRKIRRPGAQSVASDTPGGYEAAVGCVLRKK